MVEVAFGKEVEQIRITRFIVMNNPLIEHNNGSLQRKVSFIPIVFGSSMIHAEIVHL